MARLATVHSELLDIDGLSHEQQTELKKYDKYIDGDGFYSIDAYILLQICEKCWLSQTMRKRLCEEWSDDMYDTAFGYGKDCANGIG